ncbi:MAG: Uma2 family endonuclease [Verrucomicrobiales bacterium]
MPGSLIHRFTVDEYYRMAETGVIRPDARVELLDGQIRDMMPIGSFHASVVDQLADLFFRAGGDRWLIRVQSALRLDKFSEPQPDLMLLKRKDDFYRKGHPRPSDVFLLIEVADSSVIYDREEKLPAYARGGLNEVWIVNIPQKQVEVYREPHFLGYEQTTFYGVGDSISPQTFSDISIKVGDLVNL